MTKQEILDRIDVIEKAISTQPGMSLNHTLILGGEWHGLRKAIGIKGEGVWSLVNRLRGI